MRNVTPARCFLSGQGDQAKLMIDPRRARASESWACEMPTGTMETTSADDNDEK